MASAETASASLAWHWFVNDLPVPAFIKNQHHQLIAISDSFCSLVGASRDQILGFQDFEIHPGVGLLDRDCESSTLQTGVESSYDRQYILDSGEESPTSHWLRIRQTRTHTPQQEPCLIGTVEDVTRLVEATQSLEVAERQTQIAFSFDSLTGLMNRSQMEGSIVDCLNQSHRDGTCFAVLLVDLNGFKTLNSMAGHGAGDQALRVCAKRIQDVVRGRAAVARMGADEYVVLLPDTDAVDAGRVANRINEMIQMPIDIGGSRRELTSSIGVSLYPRDAKTCGDLLRKSDQAMLDGKRRCPSGSVRFYHPTIGQEVERKLQLSRDLAKAVRSDEIELHFQPIVRHHDGQDRVLGYESLARWMRNGHERVSPEEFIPLLEQGGHIVQAGENILARACEFISAHASDEVYVSVNVSGRQLLDQDFITMVKRVIRDSGVRPQQVAFELTETLAMDDKATGAQLLDQLIEMGIRLMIDDFGTGYSNLSRLRELPFSMLKIDRSLIENVPSNRSDCAILRTLIRMAEELEMGLVVEGIEAIEQRDYLVSLGVDTFQGYLFGKPKPIKLAIDRAH